MSNRDRAERIGCLFTALFLLAVVALVLLYRYVW